MHAHESLSRDMVNAFRTGDLATVASHFAPDAIWELPGTSVICGTYRGPEEIIGFLGRAFELSGGTLGLELIDVLGSDWGAVQVQTITAAHDGRVLDCVEVLAHEIREGKIARTYHRPDQEALKAFFG